MIYDEANRLENLRIMPENPTLAYEFYEFRGTVLKFIENCEQSARDQGKRVGALEKAMNDINVAIARNVNGRNGWKTKGKRVAAGSGWVIAIVQAIIHYFPGGP